mgnify:CR=1 FL=1
MKKRLLNKKLKSLATRCLSESDALCNVRDLLNCYDADLQIFMRIFLIDAMGFKEPPAVHPDKKPKRKTGQRPEKKAKKEPQSSSVSKQEQREDIKPIEDNRPKEDWEKKLYKKIMMEVHPDRLDSVSKNEMDKFKRIDFGDRMQKSPSSSTVLSIGIQLDIPVDLNHREQSRHLIEALKEIEKEGQYLESLIGWIWGESVDDLKIRVLVVKRLLEINNIQPPSDDVILAALNDYK